MRFPRYMGVIQDGQVRFFPDREKTVEALIYVRVF